MIDQLTNLWIRHTAAEPETANPNAPHALQDEQARLHFEWVQTKEAIEMLIARELLKKHLEGSTDE